MDVLRYHTTEWSGLTNKDGTGLYHEVVREIFGSRGIDVEVTYFPFKRTLLNVRSGAAHMTGASAVPHPGIILAKHPIWVTRTSAFFRQDRLRSWDGLKTIAVNLKTSISSPGIGDFVGLKLYEVPTRNQALNMVLQGRMDYYVDEHAILTRIISPDGAFTGVEGWKPLEGIENVDWKQYVIREVAVAPIYMCFQDSDEGRAVRDMYDQGYARLHKSGKLIRIYEKWGLADRMPRTLSK